MRIVALKQRLAATVENMDVMLATAATEANRDLSESEIVAFDQLKSEADKLQLDIAREQDVLDRKAIAAKPVGTVPGGTAPATVPAAAAGEKGITFARMTRALAVSRGNVFDAQRVAESWGDSGLFANQNVSTATAGGFLVPEAVAAEMIELLRPASVIMASMPIVMPMPSGNMTMNRQATGISANYVGEQQASNATGVSFGQVKLSAKKLQALVPISNDLLRSASLAADRVVRDDLVLSFATRTDLAFIRGSGTQFSPRGLRFQLTGNAALEATNILTANATVNLVNVTSDLGRLELALMNADVPSIRPTWLFAPRTLLYLTNLRDGNGNIAFPEIAAGQLRGKPFRVTTQIPVNLGSGSDSEIYLVDFGHVVVGENMGVEIAMSTEAAYLDVGGTLVSSFARDETLMRAIQQHDIGVRHLPAIAILTAVTWTP